MLSPNPSGIARDRTLRGVAVLAATAFAIWPFTDNTSARLVSVQALPEAAMCAWEPDGTGIPSDLDVTPDQLVSLARERSQQASLFAALRQGLQQRNLFAAVQRGRETVIPALVEIARAPVRTIRDTYPQYTAIAVNLQTDEVILQDINLWSTRVFNRLDDTPASAQFLEPKRIIQGPDTHIQFNNGLYVDPQNGDIYSVEADTGDRMVVFGRNAEGNVEPKRILVTPHRVYNIAVDEVKQELFVTREYPPEVVVYRKEASGNEEPLRMLQGHNTGLEYPHGLAVDSKNQLLYVNNWGMTDQPALPGSGRFNPPSISVYPLDVAGDTPPLRVIQGDRTRLNWPGAMAVDPETGELYVANDVDHSILVFSRSMNGNVAPARVIKGAKTGLVNPTGVFLDTTHQELWVSNLGTPSATVYPLKANGDVAPLRTIRSAPLGFQSLTLGKSQALAYDSTRQQILTPNWVNHPQIAAFARLAKENEPPLRKLEGQKTLLSRTMHDLAYDAIHDEIVVTSPFAQAILTFRGGASGEEPPIRVIQGPRTRIVEARALDAVAIDPVNNEIYLATSAENILVFPREANGDVEPIRVIGGRDSPVGTRSRMRIDPVRNWLVVSDPRGVLVFDRTATGNARPRAVIPGPRTGYEQFALSPTGLLITHREGIIEAWDLEEGLRLFENAANPDPRAAWQQADRAGALPQVLPDEQPVLRPSWRITAQIPESHQTGGSGITLNPAENEILTSIAARNHIWTFVVPEAFQQEGALNTAAR